MTTIDKVRAALAGGKSLSKPEIVAIAGKIGTALTAMAKRDELIMEGEGHKGDYAVFDRFAKAGRMKPRPCCGGVACLVNLTVISHQSRLSRHYRQTPRWRDIGNGLNCYSAQSRFPAGFLFCLFLLKKYQIGNLGLIFGRKPLNRSVESFR